MRWAGKQFKELQRQWVEEQAWKHLLLSLIMGIIFGFVLGVLV